MKRTFAIIAALALVCFAEAQTANTLSQEEKKNGWKLLFNGKNLDGWHSYGGKPIGPRWKINDGVLELHTGLQEGGDLVTNQVLKGNFELKIDWKIKSSANSGIFFFCLEEPQHEFIYNTGLELQIQDNAVYKEEKEDKKHRTGDLFGLVTAKNAEPKAIGEWNQYHVIYKHPMFDVYLNDKHIQHVNLTKLTSPNKNSAIARKRFQGPIGIQDWHSAVYFRNIKLKD